MEKLKVEINFYGPVAEHNYPCPIYHSTEKAVFQCNYGYFQPSWKAQKDGWRVIKLTNFFHRFVFNLLFKRE